MVLLLVIIVAVVTLVVLLHYECLYRLTLLMPTLRIKYRYRLVMGVFGALLAHVVEVLIFGFAYYYMHVAENLGYLEGRFVISHSDAIYFSFTTYTTLGYGDIEPFGGIRILAGIESLTGLLLITWTASFLFLEMQRYWVSR
ncbi:MAG: potassium channel family protein [Pseudohongiellaceae bacterium]|jgi:hypothetical protein